MSKLANLTVVFVTALSGCLSDFRVEYDLADYTDRRLSIDLVDYGDGEYSLALSFDAEEYDDGCPSMSDNVTAVLNGVPVPVDVGGLDPLLDLDGCERPGVWYDFGQEEIPTRVPTEISLADRSGFIRIEIERFVIERSVNLVSHPRDEIRIGEEVVLEWQPANELFVPDRGYVAFYPDDGEGLPAFVLRSEDGLTTDGNVIGFTVPALAVDQIGPGTLRVLEWAQPTVVACEDATCTVDSIPIAREFAVDIRS